ncbi:MAG: FecR domain-containing protein [Acidimicrobiia bacterium]
MAAFALAACGDDSGSSVPSATLRVHAGTVEVSFDGATFAAATDGQALTEGATVRTGADGRAAIEYFDGSVTRLDHGTTFKIVTLQILDNDAQSKVIEGEQTSGNTYNRVTALTDAASRFDIETPTATASVQGTVYAVLLNADGSTTIAVIEGSVDAGDGPVPAGFMVTVDEDGNVSDPIPIPDNLIDDEWIVYNCELDEGPDCPDDGTTTTTVAGPDTTVTTVPDTTTTTVPPTTTTTAVSPPPVTTTTVPATTTTTTVPPTTTTTTVPATTTSTTVPATTTTTTVPATTTTTTVPATTTTTTVPATTTTTTVPATTTTTTVDAGPDFDHIVIRPDGWTADAGDSTAYVAEAFAANGGSLGYVTDDTEFTISGGGFCNGNACGSNVAGPYTVTGTFEGMEDSTSLTVVPGQLDSIQISPADSTINLGQSQAYTGAGFDEYDNQIPDIDESDFEFEMISGDCVDATCTPDAAGDWVVTAIYGDGEAEANADLTVLNTGVVQVTLGWDAPVDLDLWVTDPDGGRIKWDTLYVGEDENGDPNLSPSGGYLDRDAICESNGIENIIWPVDAPTGEYRVDIDYWSDCDGNSEVTLLVNWVLTVTLNGEVYTVIEGSFNSLNDTHVPDFTTYFDFLGLPPPEE